jgi:hypothetical protein
MDSGGVMTRTLPIIVVIGIIIIIILVVLWPFINPDIVLSKLDPIPKPVGRRRKSLAPGI